MPLRTLADIRSWFVPWAITPLAILGLVFVLQPPPAYAWLPLTATALSIFLLAGAISGVGWSLAVHALKLERDSGFAIAWAAVIAGLLPTLAGGLGLGSPNASVLIFGPLGAISAWRLASPRATAHDLQASARTT